MGGKQLFFGGTLMIGGLLITGCASNRMLEAKTMRSQLNQKEAQASANESSVKDRDATLASMPDRAKQPEMQRQAEADTAVKAQTQAEQGQKARVQAAEDAKTSRLSTNDEALLPAGAKPGECGSSFLRSS
jgi:predicted lipid-binding transport protein (Tim44 family)